jgi:CO dehydrogenase/acetyl-CoA synthase beta subunit
MPLKVDCHSQETLEFQIKTTINRRCQNIVNYNMGLITNNERYNQVIDVWTSAMSIDRISNEKH